MFLVLLVPAQAAAAGNDGPGWNPGRLLCTDLPPGPNPLSGPRSRRTLWSYPTIALGLLRMHFLDCLIWEGL